MFGIIACVYLLKNTIQEQNIHLTNVNIVEFAKQQIAGTIAMVWSARHDKEKVTDLTKMWNAVTEAAQL